MASRKKAKPSYTSAIIGISLVLFLLGTLGWVVINGHALSGKFKENMDVNVNLHDNTRPELAQKLQAILDRQPFVRQTRYISKEDALQELTALEGKDVVTNAGVNPLWPQIIVNLHSSYVAPDSLQKISAFIRQSNIVTSVEYPVAVAQNIDSNFRRIGYVIGVLSVLLFITVIVLIDNTVRLAMFSNRFIIKTMQMVGATRWFIARPFDGRAIVNGLISAVIAIAGLWGVKSFAENQIPDLKVLNNPPAIWALFAGMLIVGILISLLSTHRSVSKYLKVRLDDLY
ncbi:MAG: FtsX-like permease family protein [Sphingobacteriales bacterium]|nr:MAG: FtsX-like permease family protein [Sphingobacteriales bacterium]